MFELSSRFARGAHALFFLLIAISAPASAAHAAVFQYTIEAGAYQIVDAGNGWQQIEMEGFGQLLTPGEPRLPSRIFAIGLPPEAKVRSVQVQGMNPVMLPGRYRILPAPPPMPTNHDPKMIEQAQQMYKARYAATYSSDAPYPAREGHLVCQGAYRKYNLADVRYTPFRYMPQSGRLILYPQARVTIVYDPVRSPGPARLLAENKPEVERRARATIVNYEQAREWYAGAQAAALSGEAYDFVIIYQWGVGSALEPLIDWEISKGRRVWLQEVSAIDEVYHNDTAANIRHFLRQKLAEWGIEKVLLVGDLDHVPMRLCHTERDGVWQDYPSDYYYAELSESDGDSWNADGDNAYGEQGEDSIDFMAEVDVGRIPTGDRYEVAPIARKMAEYEYSDDMCYKKNALLPMAFFDEETDNAVLADMMLHDFFDPAGWSRTRLYEHGPHHFSSHARDGDLNHDNLVSTWANGCYGYVCWAAHGSPFSIGYDSGYGDLTLFSWLDCNALNDDYPSNVFAESCSTAHPEAEDNLGKSLLVKGAVSYAGAVREGGYVRGWDELSDGWDSTLAYLYSRDVCSGRSLGAAHNRALRAMYESCGWDTEWWAVFNRVLYGNPDLVVNRASYPLADLGYTVPGGWADTIVPRASSDATPTWCPLPTELNGNSESTYFNWAWTNWGVNAAPEHSTRLLLDGVNVAIAEVDGLAHNEEAKAVNQGPRTVRGGRHTLTCQLDVYGRVWENYEDDNTFARQFVWSPYPLADGSPVERGAPPIKDAGLAPDMPGGYNYNCDGFSFQVRGDAGPKWSPPAWSAVGILPGAYPSNYDLRLWDIGDYQGSQQGFGGGYLEHSGDGWDRCDFVLVNGWVAPAGTYYAGVINHSGGGDKFRIQSAKATTITSWPGTRWNGPFTLAEDGVLDIYQCYLTAGDWNFVLDQINSPIGGVCDLAMALYGPAGAHYSKGEHVTGGYANAGGTGADESFSVSISHAGWYALVVWKTNSTDYQNRTDYRVGFGHDAIVLRWPNGGDVLPLGYTAPILWDNFGDVGDEVSVSISRDAGANWTVIDPAAPNPGWYEWVVTGPTSDQCLIRVTSTSNPAASDVSDGVFSIVAPFISVTAPNGGDLWIVGESSTITWNTVGETGSAVAIDLSRDGGTTWSTIVSNTQNDGTCDHTVSGPVSSHCRVRVRSLDHPEISDISDADFAIGRRSITVTSPNGTETWYSSDSNQITWTSENVSGSVGIEISRDNGASWSDVIADTPNDGSYEWVTTGPASPNCLMRVTSISYPGVSDTSNAQFTVLQRSITVLSPNGGDTLYAGEPTTIRWTSQHISGEVMIEISRDGGVTWSAVAASTANDGSHPWVPSGPGSEHCLIRITSLSHPFVSDTSNAEFTLAVRSITVLSPNGGETWYLGREYNITWASAHITGQVKIEVTADAGMSWVLITPGTPNDGSHPWRPRPLSTRCRIRVTSLAYPSVIDASDANFVIAQPRPK